MAVSVSHVCLYLSLFFSLTKMASSQTVSGFPFWVLDRSFNKVQIYLMLVYKSTICLHEENYFTMYHLPFDYVPCVNLNQFVLKPVVSQTKQKSSSGHGGALYKGGNISLYVVARNFFLFLLNCSAWPCLGPA